MKLGAYNLIRKIAEGGIAEIYLAKGHTKQGGDKYLVCKCIKSAVATDAEFLSSIICEAHFSVNMRHPNIMEVFDLCRSDGRSYLTMEFMDAGDFHQILSMCREKGQKLPLGVAIYVVSQAALGLHYAHELCDEKGEHLELVHRDISPENILLNRKGDVKIADFGIAKTNKMPDVTPPDIVKGKFGYMSPEQAWCDKADRRSDIFSLAVVLYEATTNRLFNVFNSVEDMLMAARTGQFTKPTDIDPNFPRDLEQILLKALDLDKKLRYQTALEFKSALEVFAYQNGLNIDRQAWLDWMHSAMLDNSPALPLMSAAEIPDDKNSVIRHRDSDESKIELDTDRTIPLLPDMVIEELKRLAEPGHDMTKVVKFMDLVDKSQLANVDESIPRKRHDSDATRLSIDISSFNTSPNNEPIDVSDTPEQSVPPKKSPRVQRPLLPLTPVGSKALTSPSIMNQDDDDSDLQPVIHSDEATRMVAAVPNQSETIRLSMEKLAAQERALEKSFDPPAFDDTLDAVMPTSPSPAGPTWNVQEDLASSDTVPQMVSYTKLPRQRKRNLVLPIIMVVLIVIVLILVAQILW